MKTIVLLLSLLLVAGFCIGYSVVKSNSPLPPTDSSLTESDLYYTARANRPDATEGIKWNDTLYKHLPANLDTTIVVKDANGTPLTFRQYIKPLFNKDAFIYQDKGVWQLQRRSDGARDSLSWDIVVARSARWAAFQSDTVKSWRIKFQNISHVLAQADYVLVLKSKRKMILKRKGLAVKTFHINLGKTPVGKKQFENDGKTPEGVYHLDLKYYRNDAYYKSLLTSYPNDEENRSAQLKGKKAGMAIMIHGTKPDKTTAKDWTAGCIALQNKDMDTLFEYVSEGTLIEIRP